jgi:hypothetical protein
MGKIVDVPNHGLVSFPDDWDDGQILQAINRDFAPIEEPSPITPITGREWPDVQPPGSRSPLMAEPQLAPVPQAFPAREQQLADVQSGFEQRRQQFERDIPRFLSEPPTEAAQKAMLTGVAQPEEFPQTPKLSPEDLTTLGVPEGAAKPIAGLQQAISGVADFFLTPWGLTTLGMGEISPAAARGIAHAYTAQMALSSPGQLIAGFKALSNGDTEGAARELVGGLIGAGFAYGGVKHGISELRAPAAPDSTVAAPARIVPPEVAYDTALKAHRAGQIDDAGLAEAETKFRIDKEAEAIDAGKAPPAPIIGVGLPHVSDYIGNTIDSRGVPIGVIVGGDESGLFVHYHGQNKVTVLPYSAVGLQPGLNVRVGPRAALPELPADTFAKPPTSTPVTKPPENVTPVTPSAPVVTPAEKGPNATTNVSQPQGGGGEHQAGGSGGETTPPSTGNRPLSPTESQGASTLPPQEETRPAKPVGLRKRRAVEQAAAQVKPNPTEAQKEAGNFQKGHVSIDGIDISIENAKGSIRSGTDKNGKPWEVVMPAHYGYVKGTVGRDKDHVDVYVGDHPEAPTVYVVDQKNLETGKFDEHKALLGFQTQEEAVGAYTRAFSDAMGMYRVGGVTKMTKDQFKEWLNSGNTKKPVAEPPVAKPAEETPPTTAIKQAPEPASFDSVDALLKFREVRLREERELYKEQIGLDDEQAETLQRFMTEERDTAKFEKKLTPEQQAKFTAFFDGPFNQRSGPWKSWEVDKRFDPSQVALETDREQLAMTLTQAVNRGIEEGENNDRFLSAVIAARRLKELGGTKSDIARYLDNYTTRESTNQADKTEFFKSLGGKVNSFLQRQGIELPQGDLGTKVGMRTKRAVPTPVPEAPIPELAPATPAESAGVDVQIAGLKQELAKEQKALNKQTAKLGGRVPPPITAELSRKIATRMAKIQDQIDALEKQKAKPVVTPAQAAAKVETEVKAVAKTEGQRPAKDIKAEIAGLVEAEIAKLPKLEGEAVFGKPKTYNGIQKIDVFTDKGPLNTALTLIKNKDGSWRVEISDTLLSGKTARKIRQVISEGLPLEDAKALASEQVLSGNKWHSDKPISDESGKKFSSKKSEIEGTGFRPDPGTVTLDIPGDGTFTIPKTRFALERMLAKVKAIETSTKQPKGFSESLPTKEQGRQAAEEAQIPQPPEAKYSLNPYPPGWDSTGFGEEPLAAERQHEIPTGQDQLDRFKQYGNTRAEQDRTLRNKLGEVLARDSGMARYIGLGERNQETGRARLSQSEAGGAALLERLFGIRVVTYHDDVAPGSRAGVSVSGLRGVVFVDANDPKPLLSMVGHELLHQMRVLSPDLYNGLRDALRPLAQNLGEWEREAVNKRGYDESPDNLEEELIAHFQGEQFLEPKFWDAFKAKDPSLFSKVANAILNWFNRIISAIRETPYKASQFFSDVTKARDILAKAVADFASSRQSVDHPLSGPDEIKFSLNPINTEEEYRKMTASFDRMKQPQALKLAKAFHAQNQVTVGHVAQDFAALPPEVQTELPEIGGRIEAMNMAQAAAGQMQKAPYQAPAGDLRKVAEAVSPEIHDQALVVMGAESSIFNLLQDQKNMAKKAKETAAEASSALRAEREALPKERALRLSGSVIDVRRDQVLRERAEAVKAGDDVARDAADAELANWTDIESSGSNVLGSMVKDTPDAVLRNPASTAADVLAAWKAANPQKIGASPEVVAQVEKAVASMPNLAERLLGIKDPEMSDRVKALQAKAQNVAAAKDFLDRTIRDPAFQENYKQATELTGAAALMDKESKEGHPVFINPADPTQSVELRQNFTREGYLADTKALETAERWYSDYLDPTKNPNADPLKRFFAEEHLAAITNKWMNQLWDPESGKSIAGGFNAFDFIARHVPGMKNIPAFFTAMSGGPLASKGMWALANYSEFLRRSQQIDNRMGIAATKPTKKAFTKAKMELDDWLEKIANRILSGYNALGAPERGVGDKIDGHVITSEDMAAVRAQKAYVDAQRKGAKETLGFATGKGETIKTRDQIGDLRFEREAQDTSGMTVPRGLARNTIGFTGDWMKIHDSSELTDTQKLAEYDRLLSTRYLDQVLRSHIETHEDPSYAADVNSPFKKIYQDLQSQRDLTGKTHINSVADLVDEIFGRQRNLPPDQQMAKADIREQILKEIDGTITRFTADEKREDHILDPDKTRIDVTSAENFMNRPRGKQILPRGLYTYHVGTEESQARIRGSIGEIFAQRYVNEVQSLHRAIQKQVNDWKDAILKGLASPESIRQGQINGENFLNFEEAKENEALVGLILKDIAGYVDGGKAYDHWLLEPLSITRSLIANTVLSRKPTMLQNWMGAPFKKAWLEMTLLRSGHNWMQRNPVIGGTYYSAKYLAEHGANTVRGILGAILNQPEVTPKMKAMADYLHNNQSYWAKFAGGIADYMMRQQGRVEMLQKIGVKDDDPLRYNWDALLTHWQSGGQLREGKQTTASKAWGTFKTGILLANEMGLQSLSVPMPRSMGVGAVDTVNNMLADTVANRILGEVFRFSQRALDSRATLGLDPRKTVLTAQEVFGRKDARPADLVNLKAFFDAEGINLDQELIRFWQRRQTGAPPITLREFLTPEKYESLVRGAADYINKSGFKNRPFYKTQAGRWAGLMFGYGANDNAQLARSFSEWSRDPRHAVWKDLEKFQDMATLIVLLSAFGAVYQPLAAWIRKFFYNQETQIRPIWKSRTPGEAVLTDVQNMAGQMPILGRAVVNLFGAAAPGSRMSAYGIQLFPLSMAESVMKTFSKAWQTKQIVRPFFDLYRQFVPDSAMLLNRVASREGLNTESNVRSILTANAPVGVEIKPNTYQTGAIQYGPARAMVDNVVNALSRTGGPDMATVRTERKAGVDALVKAGKDRDDAEAAFDKSIIARNPFMATYGRNLTDKEMAELRKSLPADQLAELDTFVKGRQAYAREFGLNEPDYIHEEGGGGGGRAPASPLGPAPMSAPSRSIGLRASAGGAGIGAGSVGLRGGGSIMGGQSAAPGLSTSGAVGGGIAGGGGVPRVVGIRGGGRTKSGLRGLRSHGIRGLRGSRVRSARVKSFGLRGRNSRGIRARRV